MHAQKNQTHPKKYILLRVKSRHAPNYPEKYIFEHTIASTKMELQSGQYLQVHPKTACKFVQSNSNFGSRMHAQKINPSGQTHLRAIIASTRMIVPRLGYYVIGVTM
jgi:hypothetical protein